MQKRVILLASLFLVTALIFSGCSSRSGAGSWIGTADPDELFVDLPAIVIDYESDGTASIGGLSHKMVGGTEAPGGMSLSPGATMGLATSLYLLSLDARWVQHFMATNIQHIQVNNGADGIYLMVNGMQVPSLVWEEGSLAATADAAETFGLGPPALDKVLPLLQRLGVGAILRFPAMEGTELIPTMSDEAWRAKLAQADLSVSGGGLGVIDLPVIYNADGSWSLWAFTDVELSLFTGLPLSSLRLSPSILSDLAEAGVTTVGLQTDQDGIHISVNGNGLPYLSWGSGEVQNVLVLSRQLGLLEPLLMEMSDGDVDSVLPLVESLLPMIRATSANITIYLPGSDMGN
jgi:predicted small secreted protein